jgi:hypothetical protein
MLSDAVTTKKQNGEAKEHVEVLDVSQILLRSMAPVGAPGTASGPEVGTPGADDAAARSAAVDPGTEQHRTVDRGAQS